MPTGLTIVKKFTYRGNTNEEWSNQYWFTGTTPADDTAWLALMNAVVAGEKTLYPSTTTIVRAYGYDSDAAHATAVYANHFDTSPAAPVAGTFVPTDYNALALAGDTAAWIRWTTSRMNSAGKRIYLRKYFHPAYTGLTGGDTIIAAWRTLAATFATLMDGGTLPGSRKITASSHTDVITGHTSSSFATTRSLKRRGKRPGS